MMSISFFKEVLNSGLSSPREECRNSISELEWNKCCSLTLHDSRDYDFNKIENRIAYIYKFGDNVMILAETFISNYFNQCSEDEKIYFSNHGRICSLSNGPGLDIIGYLSALVKSNTQLNCYPILKCINCYESWRDVFQILTSVAYEYCTKSYLNSDQNPSKNIQYIQCDIFTSLSPEAKECIENSDILLMSKVFSSTKSSLEVVTNTLKEILMLLKPGSMVFYIASKRNVKTVGTLKILNQLANIKFGPIKVTVENASLNSVGSETTGLTPIQVDKSYFIVLQKKSVTIELSILQEIYGAKKKSRNRKKKIVLTHTPSVSSCEISTTDNSKVDNIDIDSSISGASSYNQPAITSDESKCVSYENVSQLEVTHLKPVFTSDCINKIEYSENLPQNTLQTNLQTFLNANRSKEHSCNCELVTNKGNNSKFNNENNFKELDEKLRNNSTRETHISEDAKQCASKDVLMEVIESYSSSKEDSLNETNLTDTLSSAPAISSEKIYKSVEFKKPIKSKHFDIVGPAINMASTFRLSSPFKYIPPHKRNAEVTSFSENAFSVEEMKSINGSNCLEQKASIGNGINFTNGSKKSLPEICTQTDRSCVNLRKKSANCCEERKKETCSDGCKRKLFLDNINSAVLNRTLFNGQELKSRTETKEKETRNSSNENYFYSAGNSKCTKEFTDVRNKDAVYTMIERCENLVTSLEGLVANISNNMNSMNEQSCCKTESCPNCRLSCLCSDYCCEQSHLRKNCCKRITNHVCMACPKSVCKRACDHEVHATCNKDVNDSRNSRQPYLVLPVQNESIPFILNLISKN